MVRIILFILTINPCPQKTTRTPAKSWNLCFSSLVSDGPHVALRGGENVEPIPLETKLTESIYISTAVVIGQDERNLGALILPNQEELVLWAQSCSVKFDSFEDLVKTQEAYKFIDGIVRETICAKNGFRAFERIPRFALLSKPFEVGRELSAKQELMRYKITELYPNEVKSIFRE